MAKLSFRVPHHMSQEDALARTKKLLTAAKKEHGHMVTDLKESWEGNQDVFSFSAKGYVIQGILSVTAKTIDLEANVPAVLSLFKGKIQKIITQRAKELFIS